MSVGDYAGTQCFSALKIVHEIEIAAAGRLTVVPLAQIRRLVHTREHLAGVE